MGVGGSYKNEPAVMVRHISFSLFETKQDITYSDFLKSILYIFKNKSFLSSILYFSFFAHLFKIY